MDAEVLKKRSKQLALKGIRLFQELPRTTEARILGKQFLRSITSVAANYRAACRARSQAEFFAKLSIVVEEADETLLWLELLIEANIVNEATIQPLYKEAQELLYIFSASRKTVKNNLKAHKSSSRSSTQSINE